jgi:hypothetical protein
LAIEGAPIPSAADDPMRRSYRKLPTAGMFATGLTSKVVAHERGPASDCAWCGFRAAQNPSGAQRRAGIVRLMLFDNFHPALHAPLAPAP